jgi:hypothetical protein
MKKNAFFVGLASGVALGACLGIGLWSLLRGRGASGEARAPESSEPSEPSRTSEPSGAGDPTPGEPGRTPGQAEGERD